MLKVISLVLIMFVVAGCVSEPSDKRLKSSNDFDSGEAAKNRVSLGLTYLKNGNFSQAKFNLDKALEFAPRSGQANYAMAFYYQQVDELERAEEYYKTAIDYSRNDPDVLNSYGAFLCKQGQFEKAKIYFLKAVDDKSYISAAEAYENLAICLQSQGEIDQAIDYFNNALNHQPTRASSLLYIAQLYTEQGQWQQAKRSLWKYERNASVSAESIWLSYQIANGLNDIPAALEYAQLLKRLYPDNENTKMALVQLGKFQPDMTITKKNKAVTSTPSISAKPKVAQVSNTGVNKQAKVFKPTTPSLLNAGSPQQLKENESKDNVEDNKMDSVINANAQETPINDTSSKLQAQSDIAINAEVNDNPQNETTTQSTSFHIVQENENLYRISLKYNVKLTKLLEWNKLMDDTSIHSGTKLWVRDPNTNE